MGKYRMIEPWGYQDENNYQGSTTILDNDLDSFFADVEYNKDDNKIHFSNKDGEEKGVIDVSEFVKSQTIVERAWYEDGKIHIKFTNGDEIIIDVEELIDENEFGDGLQVNEGNVSVLINSAESDEYISVGEAGIKLFGVKRDIDAEAARATEAEEALDTKIDAETARATEAEGVLDEKISAETARATEAEGTLDEKITNEVQARENDVDEEETRAKAAELAEENRAKAEETAINRRVDSLNDNIDAEKSIREAADIALDTKIETETSRATNAEAVLDGKITAEKNRAEGVENTLNTKIEAETSRATSAETELQNAINTEAERIDNLAVAKFDNAEYDSSEKKINFYAIGEVVATIDATDFIKDGMVDDVKIENGYLVISFNTDSGKQAISIPLTDIFNPSNYYNKTEIDEKVAVINDNITSEVSARESEDSALDDKITALEGVVATKVDKQIQGTNGKALIFNESDGGGAKFEHNDGTWSFAGVNDGGENGIAGQIYALKKNAENKFEGTRIDITKDAMYYTVGSDAAADRMVAENEIATKGDIPSDFYSQEEVNALIKAKETEIYNLTKIVGEMGGNVTYTYPNELGTSLTELLKNNGTVKLNEDVTISRFGPGVTAKNKVTLNLNNHNLTSTAAGGSGAIMARGTQQITIGGKGTIDAGDGICIEANGTSTLEPIATINLTGSTTTYRTNRPGGELIYCYVGTINITNGTFRNDGESNYTLNCYDANYQNGTAKIIVTGGKFYDFNPADNSAEGEHTSFVPEGYHVETSTVTEEGVEHTIYTVKKDA